LDFHRISVVLALRNRDESSDTHLHGVVWQASAMLAAPLPGSSPAQEAIINIANTAIAALIGISLFLYTLESS
jgi:hypothetical protein